MKMGNSVFIEEKICNGKPRRHGGTELRLSVPPCLRGYIYNNPSSKFSSTRFGIVTVNPGVRSISR